MLVCVNKFSVKPSSQYSYSEMGSKNFYRCFEVDDVGVAAGKPVLAAQRAKTSIPIHPRGALRREGRPVRPWREAHSAYRLALTVKGAGYGPGSRTPSPACSTPGATTPDVVPPTPPGPALPAPRRIDVYSYKVPARPEAKSALQGRGTGLVRWWGMRS